MTLFHEVGDGQASLVQGPGPGNLLHVPQSHVECVVAVVVGAMSDGVDTLLLVESLVDVLADEIGGPARAYAAVAVAAAAGRVYLIESRYGRLLSLVADGGPTDE